MDLKQFIRDVPDFPKPGILFRDISPLLENGEAWQTAVNHMAMRVARHRADVLAGIDARGFLVAAPIAYKLGIGFTMVRKKGKLPWQKVSHTYELEYGSDTLELHEGAFKPGQRVVVCDDLLATGGTAGATLDLVRKCGGEPVAFACLIELADLKGREKLGGLPVEALLTY